MEILSYSLSSCDVGSLITTLQENEFVLTPTLRKLLQKQHEIEKRPRKIPVESDTSAAARLNKNNLTHS